MLTQESLSVNCARILQMAKAEEKTMEICSNATLKMETFGLKYMNDA